MKRGKRREEDDEIVSGEGEGVISVLEVVEAVCLGESVAEEV